LSSMSRIFRGVLSIFIAQVITIEKDVSGFLLRTER
jgi:hypothetical protein